MKIKPLYGHCSQCDDNQMKRIARKRDMLCAYHYNKEQSVKAVKRKIEKEKEMTVDGWIAPKKIARRSRKRAAQEKIYLIKRGKFLTKPENEKCQVQSEVCSGNSNVVHHTKGRIGELLLDESHWMASCAECNLWIEENSKEAREKGFTKIRFTKKEIK